MASATFNPDADPETTSVDGWTVRSGVTETWATIRGGAGTDSSDAVGDEPDNLLAQILTSPTSNRWEAIARSLFLFDTSSLPDTAIISAAQLNVYITTKADTVTGQSVVVVASTPASNTAVVTADYSQLGSTALCTPLSIASITTSAYNAFVLNATGIAAISTTGVSKFGLRIESDRANTEPTWASTKQAVILGNMANGTNKPQLQVTYTIPGQGNFNFTFSSRMIYG